jgi:hypothetical protein
VVEGNNSRGGQVEMSSMRGVFSEGPSSGSFTQALTMTNTTAQSPRNSHTSSSHGVQRQDLELGGIVETAEV